MAIGTPVQLGTANGTSTTSIGLTLTAGVAQGAEVIVGSTWGASTGGTVTVTDSRGNTYTQNLLNTTNNTTTGSIAIFSAPATTALQIGDVITIHYTISVNSATVGAYSVTGLANPAIDVSASAVGSSNAPSSGSVTTTVANELLFGLVLHTTQTPTPETGWTALDHNGVQTSHFFDTQYDIVSSTGSVAATWSGISAQAWVAGITTFKAGAASPPANTVAPAVTGTATVGSTLTTTNGTWTDDGSPTFTYQWQRDVAGNGVYGNITSATSSTYVLVSADDTCHVRCVVTDTDSHGATAANSNATAIVTFAVPVNSVAPVVSGNTVVGSVLSTTNGTWSNSPTSFGYQWTRDGVNISAATSSTYTSVSADATHAVGCTVTATNDGGSASGVASSNTISVVTAPSLSTVAGKTGTSGTAVMQKAKSGWTYITGKKNTSGTAVDQKGLGGFTKIKGH